jgi:hypothetical protein
MSSEIAEAVAAMIAERGQVSQAELIRRRQAKAQAREARKAARAVGMARRHAAKMARLTA